MKLFIILVYIILNFNISFSQSEYKLPLNTDSSSINLLRFNYSSIERPSSNLEKLNVIKTIINLSDSTSVLYFAGYDEYYKFVLDFQNLVDSIPKEYKENIHFVKLNNDSIYDVIYDRINFGWDFQSIYYLIFDANKINRLPGFIIVNIIDSNKIVKIIETYQWTCCDSHYDFYNQIVFHNDTIQQEITTIISRLTYYPKKIIVYESKKVKLVNDSAKLIAIKNEENDYLIKDLEDEVMFSDLKYIDELIVNNKTYVFVKAKVLNKVYDSDYILAWIRKDDIIISPK